MSEENDWLIGADQYCDFVFDVPTVSGKHCHILKSDDGYLLTDLQSTNGTFVNGIQIKTSQIVTAKDEIRLGEVVIFPWKLLGEENSQCILRVGRSDENDIVLDNPLVSMYHAQIIVNNGCNIVQDLGSTNGTSIDSLSCSISTAQFTQSSTIYFATHAEPASRLLKFLDKSHRTFSGHCIKHVKIHWLLMSLAMIALVLAIHWSTYHLR